MRSPESAGSGQGDNMEQGAVITPEPQGQHPPGIVTFLIIIIL